MPSSWIRSLTAVALLAAGCRPPRPATPAAEPPLDRDTPAFRALAAEPLVRPAPAEVGTPIRIRLLGINDFHGQFAATLRIGDRPVGGAAVLAAYLRAGSAGHEDRTLIVHAGDHVGATPPVSALLQDEPSIELLNLLANEHCVTGGDAPRCNVVGALGNHEFDDGQEELRRLLGGGNHRDGPFLQDPYRGARYPTLCANVLDSRTGRPIVPAHVVRTLGGVRVGIVGAVVKDTPMIVRPAGVVGLTFGDEADGINRSVAELRAAGVRAVVVAIHQGGAQGFQGGRTTFDGPEIRDIVARLDDEVDVVISGHSHAFANTVLRTAAGKEVLVTQSFSRGTAVAEIDLLVDPGTQDIVGTTSRVITTYGDAGPGSTPDPAAAALTAAAERRVAPWVALVAGTAAVALPSGEGDGESALGNLVADGLRSAARADLAFVNAGGLRAGLPQGTITWGDLLTVQPFGNRVVTLRLAGRQVRALLEQQWTRTRSQRLLHVSGLRYTWDGRRPAGDRVTSVTTASGPLRLDAEYTVAVYDFLAGGGDGFSVLREGKDIVDGPSDVEALAAYVASLPQPFRSTVDGRVRRDDVSPR